MEQRVIFTGRKCYQLGCRRWRQTNLSLQLALGWSWKETPEPPDGLRTVSQRQHRVTKQTLSYSSAV